mgnify:CR=1 FL=1
MEGVRVVLISGFLRFRACVKKEFSFPPFTKGEAGGFFYLEFTPKSNKIGQISPIIVSSNEFPHSLFNGGISILKLHSIPPMLTMNDNYFDARVQLSEPLHPNSINEQRSTINDQRNDYFTKFIFFVIIKSPAIIR